MWHLIAVLFATYNLVTRPESSYFLLWNNFSPGFMLCLAHFALKLYQCWSLLYGWGQYLVKMRHFVWRTRRSNEGAEAKRDDTWLKRMIRTVDQKDEAHCRSIDTQYVQDEEEPWLKGISIMSISLKGWSCRRDEPGSKGWALTQRIEPCFTVMRHIYYWDEPPLRRVKQRWSLAWRDEAWLKKWDVDDETRIKEWNVDKKRMKRSENDETWLKGRSRGSKKHGVAQRDETWLKEFCKRLGERVSSWLA